MNSRQPRIEVAGQTYKAVRGCRKYLENRPIQPYPDGELQEHRPQASDRVHPILFVNLHRFRGDLLPVFAVAFLHLLYFRLNLSHLFHLTALSHRQGEHHTAHHNREDENAHAKVIEEDAIQQHQAVHHRIDDDCVPNIEDYFQCLRPNSHEFRIFTVTYCTRHGINKRRPDPSELDHPH